MNDQERKKRGIGSFPGLFWLVVLFEFFERGSYYGMMSFISVYFVDVLGFPKENVGIIKGVIQPLLYFLPILSGAVADRFGYRRVLMVAFTLLGGGYFLTSQASTYGAVFAALVIVGVGAGLFKPVISGTIAKITDKENSALGFGIFYWSINLGAFVFPLILVPFLKAINPSYVIIASAIGTAIMLIPTALFFKDSRTQQKAEKRSQANMIQTLANAFEIIYSPIVLIYYQMKKSSFRKIVIVLILLLLAGYSAFKYSIHNPSLDRYPKLGIERGEQTLIVEVNPNMLGKTDFILEKTQDSTAHLTLYKPGLLQNFISEALLQIQDLSGFETATAEEVREWTEKCESRLYVSLREDPLLEDYFHVSRNEKGYGIVIRSIKEYPLNRNELLHGLHEIPELRFLNKSDLNHLVEEAGSRNFLPFFVVILMIIALIIIAISSKPATKESSAQALPFLTVLAVGAFIWFIPGLNLLGRIIASVIYITVTSLFLIDKSEPAKFADHAKFLLMIFLYSGFWVLYFQMFDSVLWYVQAYVDASSLNQAVNGFLGKLGIESRWFFDVEHVTVINAGTIILLQLLISSIVRKTKALPTMMFGIGLGTLGMAILAVNTNIWVFIAGISIFSIGEMTAHPKFISYIGLVAPSDRKAMYMGYLFLYGVFGSSIGSIVGARLYVHFVDYLNQPRTLWLVFSSIGLFTIIALALYNRFLKPDDHKA